jgi:hypothetical protein
MASKRKGSAFSRLKDKARSLFQLQNAPPAPIQNLREITAHIESYFGPNFFVLHEKKSTLVHIDVNVVLPLRPGPITPYLVQG